MSRYPRSGIGRLSRRLCIGLPLAAVLALVVSASAYAIRAEFGKLVVSATAEMQPRALPRFGGAPVILSTTTRIGTKDGSLPAALKTLTFELDRNGSIETKGLPTCTLAKLENTTPQQARSRCGEALVGTGSGSARVQLPGTAPVKISSPLSFFNAPPSGGRPTIIAHAYETLPKPQTLLVPIVIEKVHDGRYGFRAEVELPPIAEGYGSPILAQATLGLTYRHGGRKVGFINARCNGGRLQVEGKMTFANGNFFPATLTSPCHVAR
ncbi:MAG: hypothetical protein JST31_04050 [Actinobacteria bacterium]|nr:hypothetical protein [Actinomycetota bacterium]